MVHEHLVFGRKPELLWCRKNDCVLEPKPDTTGVHDSVLPDPSAGVLMPNDPSNAEPPMYRYFSRTHLGSPEVHVSTDRVWASLRHGLTEESTPHSGV